MYLTYLLCAKDPTDPLGYEVFSLHATLATIGTPVNPRSDTPTGFSVVVSLMVLVIASPAVSNKFFFGRGDFTIECWFRSDNNGDSPYLVDFRDEVIQELRINLFGILAPVVINYSIGVMVLLE